MPKLWTSTIEAHRRNVRDAVVDAAARLVAEHGLRSVTMSQVAEVSGIGRATLYKYFPDLESILAAWLERQIDVHLRELTEARDRAGTAGERLLAVLEAYALSTHESRGHRNSELAALLHRDEHVAGAHAQVRAVLHELLAESAAAGEVRSDIAPGELASYCLNALGGAASLPSKAAVRRLVELTLHGLRP